MKEMPPEGYTGEWIVRVPGLTGPEVARYAWDRLHEAIDASAIPGIELIFDRSRWEGGDF